MRRDRDWACFFLRSVQDTAHARNHDHRTSPHHTAPRQRGFSSHSMFWSTVLRSSRTTYRGSRGSGPGASSKTSARSSPASRGTLLNAVLEGRTFKRAQRGLYDGALPQSGNSIPKSVQKTLRTWRPNVQHKHIWSNVLGTKVSTAITTRAMRTIKKYGGIDAYLQQRDGRYLGAWGRALRSHMGATIRDREDLAALEQQQQQLQPQHQHPRHSQPHHTPFQ